MNKKDSNRKYPSQLLKRWKQKRALLKKRNRESGATFMEVLVTIAIIAILMTTIGLAVVPFLGQSQISVAKTNIKTIETALTAYFTMNYEYPDDSEWKEAIKPFIQKNEIPPDPWKNEYIYVKPGPDDLDYGISSAGPDGIQGNEDDINSWEL
ncbi:MAG: type II secretion system protein GspG [Spirochaetales bacterium]|nr:type II secretion system protein GspG [Spirochaetales bacterium]